MKVNFKGFDWDTLSYRWFNELRRLNLLPDLYTAPSYPTHPFQDDRDSNDAAKKNWSRSETTYGHVSSERPRLNEEILMFPKPRAPIGALDIDHVFREALDM